jgi:hypothetical protein
MSCTRTFVIARKSDTGGDMWVGVFPSQMLNLHVAMLRPMDARNAVAP